MRPDLFKGEGSNHEPSNHGFHLLRCVPLPRSDQHDSLFGEAVSSFRACAARSCPRIIRKRRDLWGRPRRRNPCSDGEAKTNRGREAVPDAVAAPERPPSGGTMSKHTTPHRPDQAPTEEPPMSTTHTPPATARERLSTK